MLFSTARPDEGALILFVVIRVEMTGDRQGFKPRGLRSFRLIDQQFRAELFAERIPDFRHRAELPPLVGVMQAGDWSHQVSSRSDVESLAARAQPQPALNVRGCQKGAHMSDDQADQARKSMSDSIKGRAKEIASAVTGNDSLTAEGQLERAQEKERKEASRAQAIADAEASEAKAQATEAKLEAAEHHVEANDQVIAPNRQR
jgi:uncharacterized protein YjbJ (UPF0337 family)